MAAHHEERAAGIERQLERSIFSDDPDAAERLRARIAELEAKRERMKAINRAIRAAGRGRWREALREKGIELTEEETELLLSVAMYQPEYMVNGQPVFPTYALSNISGNIARLRKRLSEVER